MRKRMSWDWVGDYPVFVYTTFIVQGVFYVDILVGTKGDQNADSHGPKDKPDHSYVQKGLYSKNDVVKEAFGVAVWVIRHVITK